MPTPDLSRTTRLSRLPELVGPLTVATGGRLQANEERRVLRGAGVAIPVEFDEASEFEGQNGDLVHVQGGWSGGVLTVSSGVVVHRPTAESTFDRPDLRSDLPRILRERARLNAEIRAHFAARDFLEVETPYAVPSPGTDLYLDPVATDEGYLHTSPEFAMKRLLSEGLERIYQLGKVWRGGEVTDLHHPEFTLLEWYRAWEELEAVMEDVERLVIAATDGVAEVVRRTPRGRRERRIELERPFPRVTMRRLVDEACGFDLLDALDYASLRSAVSERDLLDPGLERRHPPPGESERGRWDALFFELMVSVLEPHLARRGAVFVVDWPSPLAILARRSDDDPRVARRFELFVGGVEVADGFDELTDPDEQRDRFEADLQDRRRLDKPELPLPETFLQALEYGLPPSSGVALGVDRLLMLRMGVPRIDQVAPFAHRPDRR